MPPEVTITAWAVSSKSPAASRFDSPARAATALGASTRAAHAGDRAAGDDQLVHAVAEAQLDQPFATASRTRRSNGSTTPGPVPQVMWKRGTELPWPSAR